MSQILSIPDFEVPMGLCYQYDSDMFSSVSSPTAQVLLFWDYQSEK